MNSFLIQCKVRKAELLQFLGITAVGYLIGLIVVFIVMNVAKENTCATAGTMLAVIAFAFIHLFGITLSFMGDFNMAISLGATRKSFVSGYVLFNLLEIAVLELEIVVFGVVEKFLLENAFPQAVMEIDLTNFFYMELSVRCPGRIYSSGNVFRRSYFKIWHESVMDFMGGLDDNLSGSHEYCKE